MKVGIDLTILPEDTSCLTGVSNYAYHLAMSLPKTDPGIDYVFFLDEKVRGSYKFDFSNVKVCYVKFKWPFFDRHIKFVFKLSQHKLDLVHFPAFTAPLFFFKKFILTIHDLAIYKHPEWFPDGQWFSKNILVPFSIRKASSILVPSKSTKTDLIEIFRVGDDKVPVIPLGVEQAFFKNDRGHPATNQHDGSRNSHVANRYILCVSTIEPRKNLDRLIDAYSTLPEEILDRFDMVILGGNGWKFKKTLDKIASLKQAVRDKVKLIGSVDKANLLEFYHHASIFVFPSLYEGFGLPVLEAMASGLPIITSNISSIPEIATDCAELIDPKSVDSIRSAIIELASDSDKVRKLSDCSQKKAKLYTWENTASLSVVAYKSIRDDL